MARFAGPEWVIGFMTGTALDGETDTALVRTDGEVIAEFGPFLAVPYDNTHRELLKAVVADARAWNFDGPEPDSFAAASKRIAEVHAAAVEVIIDHANLRREDVALIGMHGQTVLHRRPQPGLPGRTRQLGDGQRLADLTHIPVAFDFRTADVAAGGQGAPLVPVYHRALLDFARQSLPAAVLNLGGVANITYVGADGSLAAFDTGPANGPINEWMEAHNRGAFDRDGRTALAGRAHEGLLAQILDHPFFDEPIPKSLDRFDFPAALVHGLGLEDGAATLTALCAACVARAFEHLPEKPERLILCGGGRRNPALVAALQQHTNVPCVDSDALGWRGDAVEAEAFAFLAARSLRGLPLSLPSTTGVRAPCLGGRICLPQ